MRRVAPTLVCLAVTALWQASLTFAGPVDANIVRGVSAQGSCVVTGISAEQCQLIALQRARASAIEQAAGIRVASSTVVSDMRLAADFIRTYSTGYVIKEAVAWLPLGSYQKDRATPPVPEYTVRIVADVYRPRKRTNPIGLRARLNASVYRSGERSFVSITVGRRARVAVFNITADDRVSMLLPNEHEKGNLVSKGETFVFPGKDSPVELEMVNLPGHTRDAEAFFVVAMDEGSGADLGRLFEPLEPMKISDFFARYAAIADYTDEVILAYEVVGE